MYYVFLFLWFLFGAVGCILMFKIDENRLPPRNLFLLFTLAGLFTILICICIVVLMIVNSPWWKRPLWEKSPYEYHKY